MKTRIALLFAAVAALVALTGCQPTPPASEVVLLVSPDGDIAAWGINTVDIANEAEAVGCLDGATFVEARWTGEPTKGGNNWTFKVDGYSKTIGLDFDIPFGAVPGCAS